MSAITTSSGSTCPGHWKGLLWRMLEKALLPDGVLLFFSTHLEMFSVSTVLAEKASDV